MIVRVLIALILSLTAAAAETPKFERVTDSPVALVADEITYDSTTGVVRARGGVEVYQAGRTLTADEIIYDDRSGQISAMGPITLRTESGETVYADTAVLDSGLRDGLIQGAKSVLANGAAKLSAVEAQRVDNRYNVLSKAVFSPCEVCAANPTPLWRIRARRIIHDEQEQEIHYENAYFDVMGVTVGFLPYFRHPSPEVDRATGILAPQFERD
ncbi:MAG: LPS-assembly protein LptD, partial [Pseudomonadota bacterium]